MTTLVAQNLEQVIRHAGEGWWIDSFIPSEGAIPFLLARLESAAHRAKERLGSNAPDLTEATLVKLYNQNPLKVRGFLQVLGRTPSPDLLLMAWRMIQGMEMKHVHLSYDRQKTFFLRAVLESPYGEEDEVYESTAIQDFALFRHVGIMEVNGKPVFDGFYPLKS